LLERLRFDFDAVAPGVDEDAYKDAVDDPQTLALTLALAKARAVAARRPGDVVIGSDQVCVIDGTVLGKPVTAERAHNQLRMMSGQTHELITAVAIVRDGEERSFVDITRLTMRQLVMPQIEAYVAHDNPLDCAGSYKIESLGAALFERVECADPTSIVGLPLMRLALELTRFGIEVLR
jgi:septum formation protein